MKSLKNLLISSRVREDFASMKQEEDAFFLSQKDQKQNTVECLKKQQESEDEVIEVFQRKLYKNFIPLKKWKIGVKRPENKAVGSGGSLAESQDFEE